jgi:hypothetical protein
MMALLIWITVFSGVTAGICGLLGLMAFLGADREMLEVGDLIESTAEQRIATTEGLADRRYAIFEGKIVPSAAPPGDAGSTPEALGTFKSPLTGQGAVAMYACAVYRQQETVQLVHRAVPFLIEDESGRRAVVAGHKVRPLGPARRCAKWSDTGRNYRLLDELKSRMDAHPGSEQDIGVFEILVRPGDRVVAFGRVESARSGRSEKPSSPTARDFVFSSSEGIPGLGVRPGGPSVDAAVLVSTFSVKKTIRYFLSLGRDSRTLLLVACAAGIVFFVSLMMVYS